MSLDAQLADSSIAPLREEFHRRAGRNLVLYQALERTLKQLAVLGRGAVSREDIQRQDVPNRVAHHTLGMLALEMREGVLSTATSNAELSPADTLAWTIRWDDSGLSETLRAELTVLVSERNHLIHHCSDRWDIESSPGLTQALVDLDAQRQRIASVHQTLHRLLIATRSALLVMVDFLASEQRRQSLQQSHLHGCLLDAVARSARADGWSPLAVIGQRWQEHLERLPAAQRDALPKLRRLLEESGLFEWRGEPQLHGGPVVFCQLKHDAH